MVSRLVLITVLVAIIASLLPSSTDAFAPQSQLATQRASSLAPAFVFGGKKKQQEDLSDIEVRDLTREEMLDINKKNEEVMNMELSMMTGFSLVLSLPILYLCWVAFFSD
jgi:hypothetical protein